MMFRILVTFSKLVYCIVPCISVRVYVYVCVCVCFVSVIGWCVVVVEISSTHVCVRQLDAFF
jgi:hypothetical protein